MCKKVIDELEKCALEHQRVAGLYERGTNAAGAAELRRVSNLLWSLARGQVWSTILPDPSGDPADTPNGSRDPRRQ